MKVYCLGELLIDMIGEEHGENGPAVFRKFAGGAAGNVAAGLAKLGLPSAFLGRVSRDMFGDFLIQNLSGCNVDTSMMVRDAHHKTTLAFVTLDENKVPNYLFYRDASASARYCIDDLACVRFSEGDALYFSSLSLAKEPIRSANFEAARRAREAGALVAFDPNVRLGAWESEEALKEQVFRMFPYVDILKVNDEEVRFLFGEGEFEEICGRLFEEYPRLRLIAVTLGKDGVMMVNAAGESVLVPAVDLPVVDTCGAGDTFLAALLSVFLTKGEPHGLAALHEAAVYANSAAHITALRKGVIPAMPHAEEVEEFIEKHHGGKQ